MATRTVLIVDDEAVVVKLCSTILSRFGLQVLSATSGEAAINLCGTFTQPIDVALLDVMMPGLSGPKLGDRVVRLHPEAALVFMSGYEDYQIAKHRPFPFKWFLRKPFKPNELVTTIRAALNEGRKRAPGRAQNVTYIRKISG